MFDLSLKSVGSRFRAAILVAIAADAVQIFGLPLFVEGAISPLDDLLDFIAAFALTRLVGWHWEFAPSLVAELVPGLNLVPFWTFAVLAVYRKSRRADSASDTIDIEPLNAKSSGH